MSCVDTCTDYTYQLNAAMFVLRITSPVQCQLLIGIMGVPGGI